MWTPGLVSCNRRLWHMCSIWHHIIVFWLIYWLVLFLRIIGYHIGQIWCLLIALLTRGYDVADQHTWMNMRSSRKNFNRFMMTTCLSSVTRLILRTFLMNITGLSLTKMRQVWLFCEIPYFCSSQLYNSNKLIISQWLNCLGDEDGVDACWQSIFCIANLQLLLSISLYQH